MLSAMLYSYADRNNSLGDPDFVKNPVEKLVSKDYADRLRDRIPPARAIPPEPLYSLTSQEGTNTTHYSIVDRYGNAVAVTYTINSYYGAGVIAGKTGFFLNNEMDDFTAKLGVANSFGLVQGKANIIEPGKRPLSSMTPTIVMKNGKFLMVTGSPGGSTITTTVLQMITNVCVCLLQDKFCKMNNIFSSRKHWLDPTTLRSNLLFIAIATLLSVGAGLLMKTSFSQTYSPHNIIPIRLWMRLAVILTLVLPGLTLAICWRSLAARRLLVLYISVLVVQILTETLFRQWQLPRGINYIVGFIYTSYRLWQLWCYRQYIHSHQDLVKFRQNMVMATFSIDIIFWTLNWLFLLIALVTRTVNV
jgi:Gamma-glutamyltranspeptidase